MKHIYLNIYGYKITLKYSSDIDLNKFEFVKNKIKDDFFYFISHQNSSADLEIVILNNKITTSKNGIYLGKTKMAKVFQLTFNERFYEYKKLNNLAQLKINFSKNKIAYIYSDNINLIYEILYILILSSSGEYLDSIGLMRIHALGLVKNEIGFIFFGSRGAGKSTLFTYLLNENKMKFYSDEICLFDINSKTLKAFPIRVALNKNTVDKLGYQEKVEKLNRTFLDEKNTYTFPKNKVADPRPISFFIELSSFKKQNLIKNLTVFSEVLIFYNIIFGIGLIQMVEFLIRGDNLITLLKILFNRIKTYIIIKKYKCLIWERSGQLDCDIDFIRKFIRNSS